MAKTQPAVVVLRTCLRLKRSEYLLLIYDHLGAETAEALVSATAAIRHVNVTACFIPVAHQKLLSKRRLPSPLRQLIGGADAVVTCVTDLDDCAPFRVAVMKLARVTHSRILHMPGVNVELFHRSISETDFLALHTEAVELSAALRAASRVEIATASGRSENYKLTLMITDRLPHMCGGVAEPGEIMNLPTGEVYIAPIEDTAEGQILINGATDRAVMSTRDKALLSFSRGALQLQECSFSATPSCLRLQTDLKKLEQSQDGPLRLGELGIGINQSVTSLTGNEIWDEKAAGTAHIALGANTPFGGSIDVPYHRDLIFFPKTIHLDGRPLKLPRSQSRPGG